MEPTHMAVKGLNNHHFEGPRMMRSTSHDGNTPQGVQGIPYYPYK